MNSLHSISVNNNIDIFNNNNNNNNNSNNNNKNNNNNGQQEDEERSNTTTMIASNNNNDANANAATREFEQQLHIIGSDNTQESEWEAEEDDDYTFLDAWGLQ
jgi:hypothetical protein